MLSWKAKNLRTEDVFLKVESCPESTCYKIKQNFLNTNAGFVICDFNNFSDPYDFFLKTCEHLGQKIPQNINKDLIVIVEDKGDTLENSGRYHKSNAAGIAHTDCPQWAEVPKYMTLFCVNNSPTGGESKFVSAIEVYNVIKKEKPQYLETLCSDFYFDKRGEIIEGESPVTTAPIFSFDKGRLNFRFLDTYRESGHALKNSPLTKEQLSAFNYLKSVMSREDLNYLFKLKPGQAVFCNNLCVAHGRKKFYDSPESKRRMIRFWIKDE